jgi:hypothetical protein
MHGQGFANKNPKLAQRAPCSGTLAEVAHYLAVIRTNDQWVAHPPFTRGGRELACVRRGENLLCAVRRELIVCGGARTACGNFIVDSGRALVQAMAPFRPLSLSSILPPRVSDDVAEAYRRGGRPLVFSPSSRFT